MCCNSLDNLGGSEVQFSRHQLENVEVSLEPGTEEVGLSVVLPDDGDERVPFQNAHVMLYEGVLEPQVSGELIQVPRTFPYGPYDPGPILRPARSTQQVPQEPPEFWVVRHPSRASPAFS